MSLALILYKNLLLPKPEVAPPSGGPPANAAKLDGVYVLFEGNYVYLP